MPDPLDLSGKWDGVFTYPHSLAPTTPFVAEITEQAGSFEGSTIEPDLHKSTPARARIVGHRSGRSIDFTKTYLRNEAGYENPVDYVGQLSQDGLSITGVWSLLDWNGEFEMTREAGLEVEQEERTSVEV
ncbi:MAG: hypothetical protein AAF707_08835 [Pseudomonadota bacterium]